MAGRRAGGHRRFVHLVFLRPERRRPMRRFTAMLSAPLSHMPAITRAAPVRPPEVVPPPPPEPLYVFLKPEIDQGLVTVLGDHAMPIVRIRNKGMFPSGSATINQRLLSICCERIGNALKEEKGPVQVIGYTDNQPIHTVRFPSNYPVVDRSRRGRARPDRESSGRSRPGHRDRQGRRRSDRLRTPTRKAATRTGASKSCCGGKAKMRAVLQFLRVPLVPDLHRRRPARPADLVLRTVPVVPRILDRPRAIIIAVLVRDLGGRELLARPPPQEERRRVGGGRDRDRRRSVARRVRRGSRGDARQADQRADAAEEGLRNRAATCTNSRGTRSSARPAPARPPLC